jgi:hypothetical protein
MPCRFTPGEITPVAIDRMLGGPQCKSKPIVQEKNLLPIPRFETLTVQPVALSLYRQRYPDESCSNRISDVQVRLKGRTQDQMEHGWL